MCLLEVDTVGLQMLAAHCQAWAAEVRTGSTTASGGMSCQATAAAVSVVDAGVNTAAEILAGQLQSTAARLTAASGSYSINDEESAGELHDLITEL